MNPLRLLAVLLGPRFNALRISLSPRGGSRLLAGLCLLGAWPAAAAPEAPNHPQTDRAAVFDLDGARILQDEDHLGIVDGRLAAEIRYRDVAGVGGLWAPPFVASNFKLDARVNGDKVPTSAWTWRPHEVERSGRLGDVAATTRTTLLYGNRAAALACTFTNAGGTPASVEFFALGWLDTTSEWGFARPASHTETTLQAEGRRLVLRQGELELALALDVPDWRWDVAGNLGRAAAVLPPHQSRTVHLLLAIGRHDEAVATVDRLLADPAGAAAAARLEYARRVDEVFAKLPVLESDHEPLVRWYHRSLVHFLMNRWEVPEFVLHPYYSTGSVNGGCVANYLWNFGEVWEILPLFDAPAARTHIRQFLQCDLLKHFLFNPMTGQADGPWYMVNQEKIIGLTYHYVLLTGDTEFLAETVAGRSIRDHMVLQAMFGDDARRPAMLIDYGPSNSHLELRRRHAYHHVMPDLNARRYANYRRAATLCDLAGQPAPFLRERAELLKPLLRQRLWDPAARWFRFEDSQGRGDLRYTVQMFKAVGSGVFDPDVEQGLLSHLNDDEFLSAWGLHSLSKRDPAFDQLDIDNGGGGICTSFPPQILERLYQAGRPELAADLLGRLLWWGDTMPYWGDSLAANVRDYRRDTPLQCTLDGVAAAQSVIFGVFGVGVQPDGDVVIRPNRLPFASRLALRGLKIRGCTVDIRVQGERFEVRSSAQTLDAPIGRALVLPPRTGLLHPAE